MKKHPHLFESVTTCGIIILAHSIVFHGYLLMNFEEYEILLRRGGRKT